MAFEPRISITNAFTSELNETERVHGFLDEAALTKVWFNAMRAQAFLLDALFPCLWLCLLSEIDAFPYLRYSHSWSRF